MRRHDLLTRSALAALPVMSGATVLPAYAAEAAEKPTAPSPKKDTKDDHLPKGLVITVVLFPGFETIDAMGPVEMLGYLEGATTRWVSLSGGVVTSAQGVPVMTEKMDDDAPEILLIPGAAPQWLKLEPAFFDAIRRAAEKAQYVLTVCTGSFLSARTGFLNGRKATSNKNAIPMVLENAPKVLWQKKARWVEDGNVWTSSGITAGMDMALGFIAKTRNSEEARRIAALTEYRWNEDAAGDPFAK